MRELTGHKVNGCNDALKITAVDEPGSGGACHDYRIEWDEKRPETPNSVTHQVYRINFQNGPIPEVGTNGITHEALLAIVIDRLESFQDGPFACRENDAALTFLESAMMWLKKRTEARLARGVEGTHTV